MNLLNTDSNWQWYSSTLFTCLCTSACVVYVH